MIRQSEEHDSGWGMAVYEHADGGAPEVLRFPEAAYADGEFRRATERARTDLQRARASRDDGRPHDGQHPPVLPRRLLVLPQRHDPRVPLAASSPACAVPTGDTDSEHFFNFLMRGFDPGTSPGRCGHGRGGHRPIGVLGAQRPPLRRRAPLRVPAGRVRAALARAPGAAAGRLRADDRASPGTPCKQDVLLTLDPDDAEEPHAERLVGDRGLARARIVRFEEGTELRGARARARSRRERAARLAGGRDPCDAGASR